MYDSKNKGDYMSVLTMAQVSMNSKKMSYVIVAIAMVLSPLLLVHIARADGQITINDCEELQLIGNDDGYGLDDNYVLGGNIDCSDTPNWDESDGFEPIGTDYERAFTGIFDGAGHTISDLTIRRSGEMYVGLFGYINSATIKNLNLKDAKITGQAYIGSLVGTAAGESLIQAVSAVNTADDTGVFAIGDGDGGAYAGGLLGVLGAFSSLQDSFARTTVTSLGESVAKIGGLIGLTTTTGNIGNSYVISTIQGSTYPNTTGPMVGSLYYSTGVNDTFWDSTVYGSMGVDDGTEGLGNNEGGRTSSWLKTKSNLIDSDWDFDDVWTIDPAGVINDGYPYLQSAANDDDGNNGGENPNTPNSSTDKNGDGIIDSEQDNVLAITSGVTDKTVVLVVDDQCSIEKALMQTEGAHSVQDSGFNYPQGLMNFTVNCGEDGFETTVTQYYYGADTSGSVVRKYNPNTNAYFNIPGATISDASVYGQTVATVAYQVKDGGELDIDGKVNGVIVDPAGLARNVVGVPNTGLGARQ
jgi:hypothetical protein